MIPEAIFQVRLKNQAGIVLSVFDDWRSLNFQRRVNDTGFFVFTISGDDYRAPYFVADCQLEIYRTVPGLVPWQLVFEAVVENTSYYLFGNGNLQFSAVGGHYNSLLGRRIIAYLDGETGALKTGLAETVMKEYVDENIGPLATSPPRLDASGVMAGFAVQADAASGLTWTGDRSGKNLLSVLQEIAAIGEVDFDVVGTGPATYEFRVYDGQLGLDRTTAGLDPATGLNAAGNTPHVFSPLRDNVYEIGYTLARRAEVNAVYVFGQGQGSARMTTLRTDAAAINASPINRREAMVGGGSQSSTSELQSLGDAALSEMQAAEKFTFQPQTVPASLYGLHYEVGDRVTVSFAGAERNKRITAVTFTVGEEGETTELEFTDIP